MSMTPRSASLGDERVEYDDIAALRRAQQVMHAANHQSVIAVKGRFHAMSVDQRARYRQVKQNGDRYDKYKRTDDFDNPTGRFKTWAGQIYRVAAKHQLSRSP